MKLIRSVVLVFICSLFLFCNSTKEPKMDYENGVIVETRSDKQMKAEGYNLGTILYSEVEGECPYVIQLVSDPNTMFDPIDLSEDHKVNGQKVWFTYNPLRMKNRCDKANPVSLEKIVIKDD